MKILSRSSNERQMFVSAAVVLCLAFASTASNACGDATSSAAEKPSGKSAEIRAFTSGRTRVVWVQGDGTDPTAWGNNLVLMGFDTDDGRGERVILSERGSYIKPLLVSGGQRIVFSRHGANLEDLSVFTVNWDGSGLKKLADGFALAVWPEGQTGREWVYLGTGNSREAFGDFKTVSRFPINRPEARELVWNKTAVSGDTFQVSADGKTAGGLFPWPKAGVAELPNGNLRLFGDGCWTAFRDAGTGLFWYFDGAHRNVTMVNAAANQRWTVPLNQAPGFNGAEVYHPRWANHPRFVAISGPYNQGGANQVRTGGAQTEVYLGRFSNDYSRIEAWMRITDNKGGDSYPDVWIDRTGNRHPIEMVRQTQTKSASASGADRVVLEARLSGLAAIPPPRSIAPYRHALVANIYDVVKVVEGKYGQSRVAVAQWAIRDAQVIAAARDRKAGSVVRFTLERYAAHPELEGERLIYAAGASELPLYYELPAK